MCGSSHGDGVGVVARLGHVVGRQHPARADVGNGVPGRGRAAGGPETGREQRREQQEGDDDTQGVRHRGEPPTGSGQDHASVPKGHLPMAAVPAIIGSVTKTLYRAGWIVAFQDGEHRILRDGCLVVEDDRIVHVGSTYAEAVDRYVDLPDRIVTPGFINTHAHLDESPIDKSVQEDVGNRQFWLTGLIEILPTEMAGLDEEGARACLDYSLIELARTGTTTVLQMGGDRGVRRRRDRGERAARLRRADVPLRSVVHPRRQAGRLRLGRRRRPGGFRRTATAYVERLRGRADGSGAGLPGARAGRHLQRGAAARLTGGGRRPPGPDLAARVAGSVGVPAR